MPNIIAQNYQWLIVLFAGIYIYNAYPELSKIVFNKFNATDGGGDTKNADSSEKIFTKSELAEFNGEKNSPGLYLSILGTVYDVEKGRKHYGPGCTYSYFVGRDASKSFITGDFVTESDDLDDVLQLEPRDILGLINWKEFYDKDYKKIGKLAGRYYDSNGIETDYMHKVYEKRDVALEERKQDEAVKELYPPCNIEWKSETGTRVWCTNQSGGIERSWIGVPRKYFEAGRTDYRCACVHTDKLMGKQLKEYDDCDPKAVSCFYKVDD